MNWCKIRCHLTWIYFPVFRALADERFKREPRHLQIIEDAVEANDILVEMLMQFPKAAWAQMLLQMPLSASDWLERRSACSNINFEDGQRPASISLVPRYRPSRMAWFVAPTCSTRDRISASSSSHCHNPSAQTSATKLLSAAWDRSRGLLASLLAFCHIVRAALG